MMGRRLSWLNIGKVGTCCNVQQLQQMPTQSQFSNVDRYVDIASTLCIKEWRRLPHVVSHIHLTYLQAAQQVMELHEAASIHKGK